MNARRVSLRSRAERTYQASACLRCLYARLGNAWNAAGRRDSAAFYYERYLATPEFTETTGPAWVDAVNLRRAREVAALQR